jgi:hypothetical protein
MSVLRALYRKSPPVWLFLTLFGSFGAFEKLLVPGLELSGGVPI